LAVFVEVVEFVVDWTFASESDVTVFFVVVALSVTVASSMAMVRVFVDDGVVARSRAFGLGV